MKFDKLILMFLALILGVATTAAAFQCPSGPEIAGHKWQIANNSAFQIGNNTFTPRTPDLGFIIGEKVLSAKLTNQSGAIGNYELMIESYGRVLVELAGK